MKEFIVEHQSRQICTFPIQFNVTVTKIFTYSVPLTTNGSHMKKIVLILSL